MPSATLGPYSVSVNNVTKNCTVGGISLAGTVPANAINVSVTAEVTVTFYVRSWEDYWYPYYYYNDFYGGNYYYYGYNYDGYYKYPYRKYYIETTEETFGSTTLGYNNGSVGTGTVQFSDFWSSPDFLAERLDPTGSVTYTVSWDVPPPNPTISVSKDPGDYEITQGTPVTVSWSTTDAVSLTVNGESIELNGSRTWTDLQPNLYTLSFVAKGAPGSTDATASVRAKIVAPVINPPTGSISLSNNGPVEEDTLILASASASNARSATLSAGSVGLTLPSSGTNSFSGSESVGATYPSLSFSLTAVGLDGKSYTLDTKTVTVTKKPATFVPPTGSITLNKTGPLTEGVVFTVTASAITAAAPVTLLVDGQSYELSNLGSGSFTIAPFGITATVPGHNFSLVAKGTDGNTYTLANKSITVNAIPVVEKSNINITGPVEIKTGQYAYFTYDLNPKWKPGENLSWSIAKAGGGSTRTGSKYIASTQSGSVSVPDVYNETGTYTITATLGGSSDTDSFVVVYDGPQPLYEPPILGSLGTFTGLHRGATQVSQEVSLPEGTISSKGFKPGIPITLSASSTGGTATLNYTSRLVGQSFAVTFGVPNDAPFGSSYTVTVTATQAGVGSTQATGRFTVESASGNHPADYGDWANLNIEPTGPASTGAGASTVLGPPRTWSGGNRLWDMTIDAGTFSNGQTVFQYPEDGQPGVTLSVPGAYNTESTRRAVTIQERGNPSTARSISAYVKTKVYVPPAPGAFDFEISGQQEPEVLVTTNNVTLSGVVGTRTLAVTPISDSSDPGATTAQLKEYIKTITVNGVSTNGNIPVTVSESDIVNVTFLSAPFDPGTNTRTKVFRIRISGGVQDPYEDTISVVTRAPSRTVGTFSFDNIADANPNNRYESNSVLVTGVDYGIPVTLTVSGDSALNPYILVADANRGTATTVYRGDSFKISAKAPVDYETEAQFSVTLKDQTKAWKITTRIRDITPDSLNFPDISQCERSTEYETITQRIAGVEGSINVSVNNGAKLIINGTNTGLSTGTVVNGDQLSILALSSSNFNTILTYRVTVGTTFDDFTVTTRARSNEVQGLAGLTSSLLALPKSKAVSNTVTLSGFDDTLPISCTSAELYVNGVLIPSGSTTVSAGSTVRLEYTTNGLFFDTAVHTVNIGSYNGKWTVRNVPNFDQRLMAEF